jgi:exopolysaccharide biosynthesis predicted pyruvyltransferase EpsI
MDFYIYQGDQIVSQRLFNLFKRYKERSFIFLEPGGNFGDILIYKGAEKIANHAGAKFKSISHVEFLSSSFDQNVVLYIHGSGGLNSWWSGTPMTILDKAVKTHKGVVILGPQTSSNDLNFLKDKIGLCLKDIVSEEIFIFARDLTTYSILKQVVPGSVNLEIDHDTALNLEKADLINNNYPGGNYKLYALRRDKEINKGVYVAYEPFSLILDPAKYCINFEHWIYVHARAKKIVSSRLHSAILGSILKIPTVLFPNNYHKNRSVWEYSLRSRDIVWGPDSFRSKRSSINKIWEHKALQKFLRLFFQVRPKDMK